MAFYKTVLAASLITLASPALAETPPDSPLDSAKSQSIRDAYAACRDKPTDMSRFLCECDIVDQQCDASLDPSHGLWRTIEVWPSEDLREREVYFYLSVPFDQAFALDKFEQGIIQSCTAGDTAITVHLGDDIDIKQPVTITADGDPLNIQLVEENDNVIAIASETELASEALSSAEELFVNFSDEWGDPVEIAFGLNGYAAAIAGWEQLCIARTS